LHQRTVTRRRPRKQSVECRVGVTPRLGTTLEEMEHIHTLQDFWRSTCALLGACSTIVLQAQRLSTGENQGCGPPLLTSLRNRETSRYHAAVCTRQSATHSCQGGGQSIGAAIVWAEIAPHAQSRDNAVNYVSVELQRHRCSHTICLRLFHVHTGLIGALGSSGMQVA
jgi:hypothetical protein